MGVGDKASNKIEDLGGKAKEAVGRATNDRDTENEGKVDQAKAGIKDAVEKVKDVFN
ncbi:CsbD family protein [Mycobacterium sp. BMJ-28]